MAIKTIGPSNGAYLENLHRLAVYDRPVVAPVATPVLAAASPIPSVPADVSTGIKSDEMKPKINKLFLLGLAGAALLAIVGMIITLAGALLNCPPVAAALGLAGLTLLVTQVYILNVGMICVISGIALLILNNKIN